MSNSDSLLSRLLPGLLVAAALFRRLVDVHPRQRFARAAAAGAGRAEYPPRRQVAVVGWQHGDVLAVIVVTGRPADGVAEIAAKLATTQDGNIGFAQA
jgi:hypothetical protein